MRACDGKADLGEEVLQPDDLVRKGAEGNELGLARTEDHALLDLGDGDWGGLRGTPSAMRLPWTVRVPAERLHRSLLT